MTKKALDYMGKGTGEIQGRLLTDREGASTLVLRALHYLSALL